MEIIRYHEVEDKIITLRGEEVIIDSDVAELYGVETKRINEAVSRNTEKFPDGYLIELTKEEWTKLKSQFATSITGGKIKLPTAFTEKGLYMLATILKSSKATETTLAIIETFTKVREVDRIMDKIPSLKKDSSQQQALLQRAGEIISDLVIPEQLMTDETEASIELNLAVVKFKYSLKKKVKNN